MSFHLLNNILLSLSLIPLSSAGSSRTPHLSHPALSFSPSAVDGMAALGNLALLLDVSSHRNITVDRKSRFLPSDVVLNLFKKDHYQNPNPYLSLSTKGIEFEKDATPHNQREVGVRAKKANSKINEVDYESSSDDDGNGNGYEDEDDDDDDDEVVSKWEKMRRQRIKLKEVEEMRELEKKAEELQGGLGNHDGEVVEETEEQKRLRVKRELEKVAREQAERRKTAELMFDLGQKAYGKGAYGRSIEFLEGALTIIPRPTLFGGEIQIWLAMAYEANQRHDDCIDLYEQLEKRHPSISIRRQAAELRYISEAPKLKISQEEMVTIPLINSYDSYASYWTDKYKDTEERRSGSTGNQAPWGGKDYLADFLVWRPPKDLGKNRAFWVTLVLWLGLVGAALFLQG